MKKNATITQVKTLNDLTMMAFIIVFIVNAAVVYTSIHFMIHYFNK